MYVARVEEKSDQFPEEDIFAKGRGGIVPSLRPVPAAAAAKFSPAIPCQTGGWVDRHVPPMKKNTVRR